MKKPDVERQYPYNLSLIQRIYRFDNNYGASVVEDPLYDNCWDLVVINYKPFIDSLSSDSNSLLNFNIDLHTKIANDVLRHLSELEVENILNDIEELKSE